MDSIMETGWKKAMIAPQFGRSRIPQSVGSADTGKIFKVGKWILPRVVSSTFGPEIASFPSLLPLSPCAHVSQLVSSGNLLVA